MFIVSLGGGSGTGFVNPITNYIRNERGAYPVFGLGMLTEEDVDPQVRVSESRRSLAAAISINNLLTRKNGQGIDSLILIDNEIRSRLSDYESLYL